MINSGENRLNSINAVGAVVFDRTIFLIRGQLLSPAFISANPLISYKCKEERSTLNTGSKLFWHGFVLS